MTCESIATYFCVGKCNLKESGSQFRAVLLRSQGVLDGDLSLSGTPVT